MSFCKKILDRTIKVDHVSNYKPPKDSDDVDELTKFLRDEGCSSKTFEEKNDKLKKIVENVKREKEEGDAKIKIKQERVDDDYRPRPRQDYQNERSNRRDYGRERDERSYPERRNEDRRDYDQQRDKSRNDRKRSPQQPRQDTIMKKDRKRSNERRRRSRSSSRSSSSSSNSAVSKSRSRSRSSSQRRHAQKYDKNSSRSNHRHHSDRRK